MPSSKQVTILIVTYNALKHVKACIASIKKYTPPIYEILIIDNNSEEATKKYLRQLAKRQKNIRVIFNKKNTGYGEANNQGIKLINTEYLCLLNSDTIVSPRWLENLINPIAKNSNIAITIPVSNCTCAIDFKTKENLFPYWQGCKKFLSKRSIAKSLDIFYHGYLNYARRYTKQKLLFKELNFPDFAGTWCVVFKKDLISKVGGLFDPQFKMGYCEDVDFCWRVQNIGKKILEVNNSFVHHYSNASFDSSKFDKHLLHRENVIKLMIKYNDQMEKYIKKTTKGDKYEVAYLATQQSMIKSFIKYKIYIKNKMISIK